MRCRVCGREIDPQSTRCDKCGTLIGNSQKLDSNEFSWNTIDFPKPKAVNDIDMNWGNGSVKTPVQQVQAAPAPVQPVQQVQPAPAVQAQPVPAPAAPVMPQMNFSIPQQMQMGWTMPAATWAMPTQQQVVIPTPYNVQVPQMPASSPVISAMPQMPAGQPAMPVQPAPAPAAPVMPQMNWTMPQANWTMPMPGFVQPQTPVFNEPVMQQMTQATVQAQPIPNPVNMDEWLDGELQQPKTSDDKFFTFYKKNEDFQKLLDEEYERYKTKYDTNAESLRRSQILSAAAVNEAASRPVASAPAPMPAKVSDNTMEINTAANIAAAKAAKEAMMREHTMIFNGIPSAPKIESVSSNIVSGEDGIYTDFDKMLMEGTKDTSEIGEATLAISNDELRKEINDLAQKIEEVTNSKPEYAYDKNRRQQNLQNMAEARSAFFDNEENKVDEASKEEIRSIFDQWDKERKEAEEKSTRKKKKGGFGKFILILLILIILFCAADYCAIRFMPSNSITEFFITVNTEASELFTKATGKEINLPGVADAELTAQEIAANKVNENIKEITFDTDSSKWNSTGEYAFDNLGAMTVVEDEKTIIAATEVIVGYNSSWIDYINEGEDITCFNYLKTDGSAFRAASNFDKLGKTEEFLKLNIGEIRKDANYLYVFTNELIKVTSGSTVTEVPSNVIYQMQLVGDTYMIVACDNYN